MHAPALTSGKKITCDRLGSHHRSRPSRLSSNAAAWHRAAAPLLLFSLAAILLGEPAIARAVPAATEVRPNVIVIFCDDLGYGDIGCFGSEKHRTPHIDRMAAEGVKLTNFYVTSGVCTPSRSSLLTGCYPRRVNMHQSARGEWVLFPVAQRGLHPREMTIAEVLKPQGYATACIGKWHLGDQWLFLPVQQGFDYYYGIPYSNDMGSRQRSRNPPLPLLKNTAVIEVPVDQTTITRRYTEQAVKFIEEHREQPFFLYLPHTMPHNPVHASSKFRGKSANAGYGDTVEEIDWSTGEILAALKRLGIDQQTLVLFTSDNGASDRFGGSNAPLSGYKGSTMEGGMRVPCVVRWPGHIPAGKTCDRLASTIDLLPTFARLAGTVPPQDRRIDGHDMWDLLASPDSAVATHEAFFYYFRDRLEAVRSGPWKLHLAGLHGRGKTASQKQPARLYDLSKDIAEKNDLAKEHPDVVERLQQFAERAREDLGDGNRPGAHQRSPGHVGHPVPLVKGKP